MCLPISLETSSAATMIKLLNQSLACPRLMKIKTLILASLLVGALVATASVLCRPLSHHKMIRRQPADTFVILLSVHINQSHRNQSSIAKPWTVAGEPM